MATLIAESLGAGLDPAVAAGLQRQWEGGALRWLGRDAAEFALASPPADTEAQWRRLQSARVDLAVQPAEGRAKRLLLADMDSTMIEQECIDELAEAAGIGARVAAITAAAMAGELDFEAALQERVALLAGLDTGVAAEVLRTRITYRRGGRALVATMRAAGGRAVLVSGGFTAFAEPIGAALGFDAVRANVLEAEGGALTGRVVGPILGREAKVAALGEEAAAMGLGPEAALAIGDGANDLGMLGLAGSGLALHAKPAVAAMCDLRVNFGDLTAALFLQGYAEADFAG